MKLKALTVEELKHFNLEQIVVSQWKEEIQKQITMVSNPFEGTLTLLVYNKKEIILETKSLTEAVKKYNEI